VQRRILPLILLFAIAANAYPPGPQVLTFYSEIDDMDQPYAVYIPKSYAAAPDSGKRLPLVISLHGAWSNHRLNLKRVFGQGNQQGESDPEATRNWPSLPDVELFVASPWARGTMGYRGIAEKDVLDMLDDMKRRFPIDEDRVYLTGLSMGGGGTLELGLTQPHLWAAIVPLCPVEPWFGDALAVNAHNLPVFIHHGDNDPAVNVGVSRKLVARMRDEGINVQYKEYPGVRHNVWDYAYSKAAVFDWMLEYKRNRFPDRVRFVSPASRYQRAYWVTLEKSSGRQPSIDAAFTGPNQLTVRSTGVDGFSLDLSGHPRYDASKPLSIAWNESRVTLEPGAPLSCGQRAAPARSVGDVMSGRHVYVYGTGGKPSSQEITRRRWEATEAADWAGAAGRITYYPRVIADSEVRPSDLEGNLILFGTAGTNSIVAKHVTQPPPAPNCIYAVPGLREGRTFVVNAGTPFYTLGESFKTPMRDFIPLQQRLLMTFGAVQIIEEQP